MENGFSKSDFHVSCNWHLNSDFNLNDLLVLQIANAGTNSNEINKSKVTLKPPKDSNEPVSFSIKSLNKSVLIESVDFISSGSCSETYTPSNGYLNTSYGVLLENDLMYPPKTFIILNSFDQPLKQFCAKFPLDKELHLYNIFITLALMSPSSGLSLQEAKLLFKNMALSDNFHNGNTLLENYEEQGSRKGEESIAGKNDTVPSELEGLRLEMHKHIEASVARLEERIMSKLNEIEQLIKSNKVN